MKTFKFKTNIKCGGCVANVTPFLNEEKRIQSWSVDTNSMDKVLTVEAEGISQEEIKSLLEKAGYLLKEEIK